MAFGNYKVPCGCGGESCHWFCIYLSGMLMVTSGLFDVGSCGGPEQVRSRGLKLV